MEGNLGAPAGEDGCKPRSFSSGRWGVTMEHSRGRWEITKHQQVKMGDKAARTGSTSGASSCVQTGSRDLSSLSAQSPGDDELEPPRGVGVVYHRPLAGLQAGATGLAPSEGGPCRLLWSALTSVHGHAGHPSCSARLHSPAYR